MSKRFSFRPSAEGNSEEPLSEDEMIRQQAEALKTADPIRSSGAELNSAEADSGAGVTRGIQTSGQSVFHSSGASDDSDSSERTVISKNVIITGSIQSGVQMEINGVIHGDVTCSSDLVVSGEIEGNIKATQLNLLSGKISGDVECEQHILQEPNTCVLGNVISESIRCGGELKGNISVRGKAELLKSADVEGDILAERISIEDGAYIDGKIRINRKQKPNAVSGEKNLKSAADHASEETFSMAAPDKLKSSMDIDTSKYI